MNWLSIDKNIINFGQFLSEFFINSYDKLYDQSRRWYTRRAQYNIYIVVIEAARVAGNFNININMPWCLLHRHITQYMTYNQYYSR